MSLERRWPSQREFAATYDAAAEAYTAQYGDLLPKMPFDCALLDAFAPAATGRFVADVGSGPGQVGEYLRGRGLPVVSLDLSWQMALRARERSECALVADLAQLPFAAASLRGLVAFYSIICVPRDCVPAVLAEFRRVVVATAPVVVAFHLGTGEEHQGTWSMSFFEASEMMGYARSVGLTVEGCEERPPYDFEKQGGHAYLTTRA